MPDQFNEQLFNVLLTQKSINGEMPYDAIERVVQDSIDYVKRENINARISNVALNINNKLVLAQIYVERQNGFAATKENKFGTTPTAYNVQVRFPFDVELGIGQDVVILPGGDFRHTLKPYKNTLKDVVDDVQRDFKPEDIVLGPGVEINIDRANKKVSLHCQPDGEQVAFTCSEDAAYIGKGYILDNLPLGGGKFIPKLTYSEHEDYSQRLKMAGVYPLFYTSKTKPRKGVLRQHDDYRGYTAAQVDGHIEPNRPSENIARVAEYNAFLAKVDAEIQSFPAGRDWAVSKAGTQYVFDLTVINGMTLFSESGLPVVRLRDYQLELFNNCLRFIDSVDQQNTQGTLQPGLAGKINMGVGAGKTFFTFTLLKHLKHMMTLDPSKLAPPFCMAPDEAVADVTEKAINRQGVTTGTSAASITKQAQMPNKEFIAFYMRLTALAAQDAQKVDQFIQHDLQAEILKFTREHCLHPNKIINFLGVYQDQALRDRISMFKDSIDMKRLLLLVEGQKTILSKTGMRGIAALSNLLEQFTAIQEGIEKEAASPLFRDARNAVHELRPLVIDYNQNVTLPTSVIKAIPSGVINVTTMTINDFRSIFFTKYKATDGTLNYRAIRDSLIKMACVTNNEAAVLLANSGGLGNTYSEEQLKAHIEQFLPIAYEQFSSLARKGKFTVDEHYQLYLYLNELFSTIPVEISFKDNVRDQFMDLDAFNHVLYVRSLNDNIQLIDAMREKINAQIQQLQTVNNCAEPGDDALMEQYGIQPNATVIETADQLAGIASLSITGRAAGDDAKLLLTHLPVFTPEGLASYFEHLASLENQPQVSFREQHGVYAAQTQPGKLVTKKDIQDRIQQILQAVMIADEVHKEEFKCLFDRHDSFYQRINAVTERYLKKQFIDALPHRIGMSGTINHVADNAFGKTTLYNLSTQKMIQQGLMKKVSVDTHQAVLPPQLSSTLIPEQETALKQEYAKQIVVDYFIQNSNLSIKNIMQKLPCGIDLFALSKGIIFSKTDNPELNGYITTYFNLLVDGNPDEANLAIQVELFERINDARMGQVAVLRAKLLGQVELAIAEIEHVNQLNREAPQPLLIQDNRITNAQENADSLNIKLLNPRVIDEMHRNAFQNNLFAIYLEYILSKSSSPKEFSDIIGLQNSLFEKGHQLIHLHHLVELKDVQQILSLMASVDPKTITVADVSSFIKARVKDDVLQPLLIQGILTHKNVPQAFAEAIVRDTQAIHLDKLITTDRDEFESGKTLAMLGSSRERTGYSHEPLGIVVDAPSNLNVQMDVNYFVALYGTQQLLPEQMPDFLASLQQLAHHTLSYDEKNQAGGRALRTPYGHVRYLQYQTTINERLPINHPTLSVLKLETQFQDIFTSNELLAQEERASITFNREVFLALERDVADIKLLYKAIYQRFAKELIDPNLKQQYEGYIHQRVPLVWAMKYKPVIAAAYFAEPSDAILDDVRMSVKEMPVDAVPELDVVPPVVIDLQPVLDEVKKQPANRHSIFKTLLLTLGAVLGAGLGVGLVMSGIFAPLGAGILMTTITAGVFAAVGLVLAYGISKLVDQCSGKGALDDMLVVDVDDQFGSHDVSMSKLKKANKSEGLKPVENLDGSYPPLFVPVNFEMQEIDKTEYDQGFGLVV